MIANIRTANSDSRGGEMLSPIDNPFSDRQTDKQTSTRLNTYVRIECLLWVGRSSTDSRPLLSQISWRHRWNIKLNVSDPRAVIASSPTVLRVFSHYGLSLCRNRYLKSLNVCPLWTIHFVKPWLKTFKSNHIFPFSVWPTTTVS